MSVSLLDVNFLIALFDPAHIHHDRAHEWFARNRKHGWATCPMTINGCIRVLSSPAYPGIETCPSEVVAHLRIFCEDSHHEFWPDSVSLLEENLFLSRMVAGPRSITDIYLLGLAVRRHGKLATFDGGISLPAVAGAGSRNLEVVH